MTKEDKITVEEHMEILKRGRKIVDDVGDKR